MSKVRIIIGPNGSGKSTLYTQFQQLKVNTGPFINADLIQQNLNKDQFYQVSFLYLLDQKELIDFIKNHAINQKSSLQKYLKHIKTVGNKLLLESSCNSYLAAALADYLRLKIVELRKSFSFESVFSDDSKVAFVKHLHKLGYEVYVYLIATSNYQINIQRIIERANNGGHKVSEEKIISRYQKSIDNAFKIIPYAKRYYVIDNSQYNLPTLVAEIEMGKKYNFIHQTYQPQWTNRFLTIKQ